MLIRPPEVDWEAFSIADIPANPEPFRLVNRVPIHENGEPLVDLRETNPELSFGVHCLPYVRRSVAEVLKVAYRKTPDHLDLRVFTALRTLDQQAEMYWYNYRKAKEEHPNWPESVLRKMTNRFFAPPDAKAPPGHCTGAAVDVGLLDLETGKALDLRDPHEGWKGAPTAIQGLSEASAENRRLLCFIMHSAGLSNCRDEFWHWSFGDSAWAVRVGAPAACYGLVEPPEGATRVTGPKIVIEPYDPAWPLRFEEIRTDLVAKLQGVIEGVEHVGSTSVPGLSAKPTLDILAVVREGEMPAVIERLKELGYAHEGDLGVEGREAFRAESEPSSKWFSHHLYACVEGSLELGRQVAFRDYLRTHPIAADDYADLKRSLAERYPWDRTRYTDAKTPFVTEILRDDRMLYHRG